MNDAPETLNTQEAVSKALAEALREKGYTWNNLDALCTKAASWLLDSQDKFKASFTPEKIKEVAAQIDSDYQIGDSQTHPLKSHRLYWTTAKLLGTVS